MRPILVSGACCAIAVFALAADPTAAAGPSAAERKASAAILIRHAGFEASCSGVLVTTNQVLTAGHCFLRDDSRPSRGYLPRSARVYVTVGARTGRRRTAATVRARSWSADVRGVFDLAVVDLRAGKRPAPVPVASESPPLRALAWEVGYRDGGRRRSHRAPVRSLAACHFKRLRARINICAGRRYDPNPPCSGDSGAPLFYGGRVVGILSGDVGPSECGRIPFIYTRSDSPRARKLIGPEAFLPLPRVVDPSSG